MTLLLEMWDGASWVRAARMHAGEQPGSLSNNAAGRREILHFTCTAQESVISRSIAGTDQELDAARVIDTVGLEPIATLHQGDTFEVVICTDRMNSPQLFRFRHAPDR